jgi:CRP-like cAMP-binding protein
VDQSASARQIPAHLFPFWKQPSNAVWEKVLHLGKRNIYNPHDVILPGNCQSRAFFYLKSGKIRCAQTGLNGNVKLCYVVQPGSIFGENIAISKIPSIAQFQADTTAIVYTFPLDLLYTTIAAAHPDLMLNLMELISYKVRMYSVHFYSTILSDVGSQVSRILYELLIENGGGESCVPKFSLQDIADVLGVHRNTITRAMQKLKQEGVIEQYSRKCLKTGSLEKLLQRSVYPKI